MHAIARDFTYYKKKKQSKDCNEKKIVCHSYVRTYNITQFRFAFCKRHAKFVSEIQPVSNHGGLFAKF